jgi:hypothetical protein
MLPGPRQSETRRCEPGTHLGKGLGKGLEKDLGGLPGAAPVAPSATLTRGIWPMPHEVETTLASPAANARARSELRARSEPRDYVVWAFVAMAASAAIVWGGLTAWIVWRMLVS